MSGEALPPERAAPGEPMPLSARPGDRPAPLLRAGLVATTAVVRLLGPRGRRALGTAGGLIAWGTAGRARRERTTAAHRRADPATTPASARRRARQSWQEYGCTVLEFIWNLHGDVDHAAAHSTIVGLEHVDAARPTGGVLALTHLGNWDMAATIAAAHSIPLTTVMAPIGGDAVTELVAWARRRNNLEVYTPDRAARGLLRALRRRRFVAILCDIAGAGPETVVHYRGGPVLMSTAPAWLAMRTRVPLLPVSCVRGGPDEPAYVIRVHPPVPTAGRTETEVMQSVADALEPDAAAHPRQWYPFGDVYVEPRPDPGGGTVGG